MPSPPGTRVRAGAPATINIAEGDMAVYVSATPFLWLGPILARIVPTEMQTAVLCAQPPPLAEMWTMQDIVSGLTDGPDGFIDQKLFRMGQAAVWPTYCEYIPAEETEWTPTFLGFEVHNLAINPQPGQHGGDGFTDFMNREADFYVFHWRCNAPSGPGGPPYVTSGQVEPIGQRARWLPSNLAGQEVHYIVWPHVLYARPIGNPVLMDRSDYNAVVHDRGRWNVHSAGYGAVYPSLGNTGSFTLTIEAWSSTGIVPPPTPRPWPQAEPVPPLPYQFTDQAVADLTAMAAASEGRWAALWLALDGLQLPEGAQQLGAPEDLPAGSSSWARPANAIGFAVSVSAPGYMGHGGSNPTAYTALGWLSQSSMLGDHPSVRIKHETQVLAPLAQDADTVKVDLSPGVTGSCVWLQPGPVG